MVKLSEGERLRIQGLASDRPDLRYSPKFRRMIPVPLHRNNYTKMPNNGEVGRRAAGLKEPHNMESRVPDYVEQERIRNADYVQPNTTAAFFNDPPPWRSALGRRS